MLNNPYPGKFIAIEGLDGAGKTTQALALARSLKGLGKEAFVTYEPTRSPIGNLIRSRLLGEWKSSPDALQLLFAADRADHLQKDIIPKLKKGIYVVSDRYSFSSFAYGAVESDLDWLMDINARFIAPDLVVYLEVSPKTCVERIKKEGRSIELFEKSDILDKVAQNYKLIFKRDDFKKMAVAYIDGNRGNETVTGQIIPFVSDLINKKSHFSG